MFRLVTPERTFIFRAVSAEEASKWIREVHAAKDKLVMPITPYNESHITMRRPKRAQAEQQENDPMLINSPPPVASCSKDAFTPSQMVKSAANETSDVPEQPATTEAGAVPDTETDTPVHSRSDAERPATTPLPVLSTAKSVRPMPATPIASTPVKGHDFAAAAPPASPATWEGKEKTPFKSEQVLGSPRGRALPPVPTPQEKTVAEPPAEVLRSPVPVSNLNRASTAAGEEIRLHSAFSHMGLSTGLGSTFVEDALPPITPSVVPVVVAAPEVQVEVATVTPKETPLAERKPEAPAITANETPLGEGTAGGTAVSAPPVTQEATADAKVTLPPAEEVTLKPLDLTTLKLPKRLVPEATPTAVEAPVSKQVATPQLPSAVKGKCACEGGSGLEEGMCRKCLAVALGASQPEKLDSILRKTVQDDMTPAKVERKLVDEFEAKEDSLATSLITAVTKGS